ncbi:MAG: hypothetical protein AAFN41_01900 [Planctomycetota bacterium]
MYDRIKQRVWIYYCPKVLVNSGYCPVVVHEVWTWHFAFALLSLGFAKDAAEKTRQPWVELAVRPALGDPPSSRVIASRSIQRVRDGGAPLGLGDDEYPTRPPASRPVASDQGTVERLREQWASDRESVLECCSLVDQSLASLDELQEDFAIAYASDQDAPHLSATEDAVKQAKMRLSERFTSRLRDNQVAAALSDPSKAAGKTSGAESGENPVAFTPTQRLVIQALSSFDPTDPQTALSLVETADISCSERTVQLAFDTLIRAGWAERPLGRTGGVRLTTNGRKEARRLGILDGG